MHVSFMTWRARRMLTARSGEPDRVAGLELCIEVIDVDPVPVLVSTARVGQLQREVRRARTRAAPLLLRHRVDAREHAILDELGDRGHVPTI